MDELEKIRLKINEIDEKMAKLFEERMSATFEVANYKIKSGLNVLDKAREEEVIKRNSSLIENPEYLEYYKMFLKDLMKTSKNYQSKLLNGLKVVYCGTDGAFSHIATKKAFPNANIFSCGDFKEG